MFWNKEIEMSLSLFSMAYYTL